MVPTTTRADRNLIRSGSLSTRVMQLSALDCFEDHFGICFVSFYRKTQSADTIGKALQALLVHYPLLSGRVIKQEDGLGLALHDQGVPFSVSHSSASLSDWRDPDRNLIGRFADRILPQVPGRAQQALMKIKLTHLQGGGSVLGIGLAHVLGDGRSFCTLLQDWGRLARGETITPLCWDRDRLRASLLQKGQDPGPVPLHAQSYLGLEQFSLPRLVRLYAKVISHMPRMQGLRLHVRGEELLSLKDQLNEGQEVKLSSHDAIAAALFKRLHALPHGQSVGSVRYLMIADLRSRTEGIPPEGAFANLSGHMVQSVESEAIDKADPYSLALQLRLGSRAFEKDHYLKQEAWLRERVRQRTIGRTFACHDPFRSDFFISNVQNLPFYDLDFGEGRPYCFTMPTEMAPRIVQVFPRPDGDGCDILLNVTRSMAKELLSHRDRKPAPLSLLSLAERSSR